MAIREADRLIAAVSAKAIAFENTSDDRRFVMLEGLGPKIQSWRPSSYHRVLKGRS